MPGEPRKVNILDTSLLLHDPDCIFKFKENIVVIPFTVLEELDRKKLESNGISAVARHAIRNLDNLRENHGRLSRGVDLPDGGVLVVDPVIQDPPKRLGFSFKLDNNDNLIIATALKWANLRQPTGKKKSRGKSTAFDPMKELSRRFTLGEVSVVTKDIGLRDKAESLDLVARDFQNDKAAKSPEALYSGQADILVENDDFKELKRLMYSQGKPAEVPYEVMSQYAGLPKTLYPNQCCLFMNEENEVLLAIHKETRNGYVFRTIERPKGQKGQNHGIEPRSIDQTFAMALLLDKEVPLVTLAGIAGSGKTLLALVAGLQQIDDSGGRRPYYRRITVYRSNRELGEKLGYLPGSVDKKFEQWTVAITDLLELIKEGDEPETAPATDKKHPGDHINPESLLSQKKIQIQPINFIQGRTLHRHYVIVDEMQNFRPADAQKIITRAGKGTKIVLTGDVKQIENPYLDALSNGLSHVVERMKGHPLFGHMTFTKSERSELAQLGAERL